jgi:hypothetical protein
MIRTKFKVIENRIENGIAQVRLDVVTFSSTGNLENNSFWEHTPSGFIGLLTTNLEAAKQFELGSEFYVDFIKASQ